LSEAFLDSVLYLYVLESQIFIKKVLPLYRQGPPNLVEVYVASVTEVNFVSSFSSTCKDGGREKDEEEDEDGLVWRKSEISCDRRKSSSRPALRRRRRTRTGGRGSDRLGQKIIFLIRPHIL
jgi:hypothetical protein